MNPQTTNLMSISFDSIENIIKINNLNGPSKEIDINTLKNYIKNNELRLDKFIINPIFCNADKTKIKINFGGTLRKFIEENSISVIVIPVFTEIELEFFDYFKSDVVFKMEQYANLTGLGVVIHEKSKFDYNNMLKEILNCKMKLEELSITNIKNNKHINLDLNDFEFSKFVRLKLDGINELNNSKKEKDIYFYQFYLRNINNLNIDNMEDYDIELLLFNNVKNSKVLNFHSIGRGEIYYSSLKNLKFFKISTLKVIENEIENFIINKGNFVHLSEDNKIQTLNVKNTLNFNLDSNNNIDLLKIKNIKSLDLTMNSGKNKLEKTKFSSKDINKLNVNGINSKILSQDYKIKLNILHKILSFVSKINFNEIEFNNDEAYSPFYEKYKNLISDFVNLYKKEYNTNNFEKKITKIILKYINHLDKNDLKEFINKLDGENNLFQKKTKMLVNTILI